MISPYISISVFFGGNFREASKSLGPRSQAVEEEASSGLYPSVAYGLRSWAYGLDPHNQIILLGRNDLCRDY